MVLNRKIGHGQEMIPINFEVTRSKVKVTIPFKGLVYGMSGILIPC